MFIRTSEALKRKRLFLICRYTLIRATGSLVIAEIAKEASFLPGALLVAIAIASNLVLGRVEPFGFFDPWLQAPVIVSDTALISMSLLLSRASQELFLFFFFVLIMAAKLESLVTLGICAAAIGFASFLLGTDQAGWASPTLMRVPFTFATGLFFGYVVLPRAQRPNVHLPLPGRTGGSTTSAETRVLDNRPDRQGPGLSLSQPARS